MGKFSVRTDGIFQLMFGFCPVDQSLDLRSHAYARLANDANGKFIYSWLFGRNIFYIALDERMCVSCENKNYEEKRPKKKLMGKRETGTRSKRESDKKLTAILSWEKFTEKFGGKLGVPFQ